MILTHKLCIFEKFAHIISIRCAFYLFRDEIFCVQINRSNSSDSRTQCRTKIVRKNDAIQDFGTINGKITK